MLCFSLISCAPPKINSQDKVKKIQSERKPMVDHEQKHITEDKPEQPDTSTALKNGTVKRLQQSDQQKTNARNYSSEIKSTQTSEEKAAQLEDILDASLWDFDEMLLKKNEELSVPSHQEENQGGNGLASQGGGQGQGDAEFRQNENSADPSTASGASGQRNAGTMSQSKEFDNDDVVARQIREAAEKETDPVLKKKLWEEYKKYKAESN